MEFKKSLCVASSAKSLGIEEVLTTSRSAWQSRYAERVIGSFRTDCLAHAIALNERHLRRLLRKYIDYGNNSRTHLALNKDLPASRAIYYSKGTAAAAINKLPQPRRTSAYSVEQTLHKRRTVRQFSPVGGRCACAHRLRRIKHLSPGLGPWLKGPAKSPINQLSRGLREVEFLLRDAAGADNEQVKRGGSGQSTPSTAWVRTDSAPGGRRGRGAHWVQSRPHAGCIRCVIGWLCDLR